MLDCGRKNYFQRCQRGEEKAIAVMRGRQPELHVNAIGVHLLAADAVLGRPATSLHGIEKVGDRSLESTEFSSA
jgi:hypothetical protein